MLEKLLKGFFVKDNASHFPPKIHNLKILAGYASSLSLTEDDLNLLDTMTDFQMEGRYPDFDFEVFEKATQAFTSNLLDEVNALQLCLLNQLP